MYPAKEKLTRFFFIILVLLFLQPFAYSQSESDIKGFLKHAIHHSIKTPFSAQKEIYFNHKKWNEHKFYSNGNKLRIEYRAGQQMRPHRIISEAPLANKELFWIENESGSVLKKKVIFRNYPTDWNWWSIVYSMLDVNRLNSGIYKVMNGRYEMIPCYRIIVKYPKDIASISRAPSWHFDMQTIKELFPRISEIWSRRFTKDEFQDNQERLRKAYFATIELLIDKNPKNPFIYSCILYDINGNQIGEYNWGQVEFTNNLDAKLFQPPLDTRILHVQNPQEGGDYSIDIYGTGNLTSMDIFWKNIGMCFNSLGQHLASFFGRLWILVLTYGGNIAAGIAVICVIVVIALKCKR